ncbi:MAG: hypothetical protein WBQ95_20620 [Terracidiphilus sp.]
MKMIIQRILIVTTLASSISLIAQTPQSAASGQSAQTAPTADEIVTKYIAAIGGKEAISKVKSMTLENSVQVMGNESPSTTTIVDGVGYKSETDLNGTQIVQCYNDKSGWIINPMAGANDPTPMPDDVYNSGKGQINVGGALYNYAAKGGKVEFMGKDGSAYKIKLTTKENVDSVYLIDSTTYLVTSLMSKGKMQDQDIDINTRFSDYRKTDLGYVIPYAIDVDFGQFALSIAVKKVEFNKTIDPAIFAMPKAAVSAAK